MIKINNLSFAYPKKPELYKNLSLELNTGSITGLLGTNGAGKTTLLKLLAGLLNKREGSIIVNGAIPFQRTADLLQQIYFVTEEYYLPASRIDSFVKANYGFYPAFDMEKFDRILADFELEKKMKLHQLSHGQKKKFIVAFALATNCKLLILDEPTNGLDIPSKALFRKILAGSIDENQLVIISTHQVKDIENLIDNIVILKDGSVAFHETTISISEKLDFNTTRSMDEVSTLFSEAMPGGYKTISAQHDSNSSEIDIELLFNAINSGIKLNVSHEN